MSDSIGNLKNSGLKGNNWPWQHKVLLGLDCICEGLKDLTPLLSPQTRDANITSDSGPGSTPQCYGFSIANIGAAVGLVDGQPLPPGATVNFDPAGLNNLVNGIGYDATGTTFLITYLS